jgi:hypothetical protein
VFISNSFADQIDEGETADRLSLRNMTDVGTRTDLLVRVSGVNTPAIAGAWDNAPYFHDGRYRTLEEVLDHTWLEPGSEDGVFVAAPISSHNPADNAFDQFAPTTPGNPVTSVEGLPLHPFRSHEPGNGPPGATSVTDHLALVGTEARNELLAFLRASSSQTDLCAGAQTPSIMNLAVVTSGPPTCVATITWSTPFPVSTRWGAPMVDELEYGHTSVGTSHQAILDETAASAKVTAQSPICGTSAAQTVTWSVHGGCTAGPGNGHHDPPMDGGGS